MKDVARSTEEAAKDLGRARAEVTLRTPPAEVFVF
jgi:hypothetical protein